MLISIKQEKTSDSFDQNNQNPFIILISLKSLDFKALIQKKKHVTYIHDKFKRHA